LLFCGCVKKTRGERRYPGRYPAGHNACRHLHSMPLLPRQSDNERMSKKEHVMKLVDEKTGLMECLVCGEKRHAVMKPGPDGKFLPENWECVNMCRLIHDDKRPAKKK
jgi:hypothetical protein